MPSGLSMIHGAACRRLMYSIGPRCADVLASHCSDKRQRDLNDSDVARASRAAFTARREIFWDDCDAGLGSTGVFGLRKPFGLQQLRDLALEFQPRSDRPSAASKDQRQAPPVSQACFLQCFDLASGHINHFWAKGGTHDRRVPSKTMILCRWWRSKSAQFIVYCRVADGAGAPKRTQHFAWSIGSERICV